jgi:hypothetical protein
MCQKYGGDTQSAIKDELKNLRPKTEGKLTLEAWREFEAHFKLLYSRLENPSEEDAYNLVAEKMPETQRRSCIREQDRRNQDRPTLKLKGVTNITNVPDATTEDVRDLVAATVGTGENFQVARDGQNFRIQLHSSRAAELLLMKNGSTLLTGHKPQFTQVQAKLTLDELFQRVETELRCQQQSDSLGRGYNGWQNQPRENRSRSMDRRGYVREVKEEEKTKSRSRTPPSRSRPNSPGPRTPTPEKPRPPSPRQQVPMAVSEQPGQGRYTNWSDWGQND